MTEITFKHFIKIPLKLTWVICSTAGTTSLFAAKKGVIMPLLEKTCHSLVLWGVGSSTVFLTQAYQTFISREKMKNWREKFRINCCFEKATDWDTSYHKKHQLIEPSGKYFKISTQVPAKCLYIKFVSNITLSKIHIWGCWDHHKRMSTCTSSPTFLWAIWY